MNDLFLSKIGHIESPFKSKFGIPRQSGIVQHLRSKIVFEPEFANPDAVRGLEAYSHLWIIWGFSEFYGKKWSPTVRPPRLGGNERVGVFATRSPHRPNPLGLSSVRLISIEFIEKNVPILCIEGADLMDQTPIFDIKPYLAYTDAHDLAISPDFSQDKNDSLSVNIDPALLISLPKDIKTALPDILAQDPRPAYHRDANRIYGIILGAYEIFFQVKNGTAIVTDIKQKNSK